MMNPLKGEVPLELNGETYKCRLTIDSLVQIEEELGLGIIEIVTELSNAKVRIKWLLVILYHALRGGGNDFDDKKIKRIEKKPAANAAKNQQRISRHTAKFIFGFVRLLILT